MRKWLYQSEYLFIFELIFECFITPAYLTATSHTQNCQFFSRLHNDVPDSTTVPTTFRNRLRFTLSGIIQVYGFDDR